MSVENDPQINVDPDSLTPVRHHYNVSLGAYYATFVSGFTALTGLIESTPARSTLAVGVLLGTVVIANSLDRIQSPGH